MAIADRVASILSSAAARVETIARTLRGPESTRVADIPGVPSIGGPRGDERTRRSLESWEAYSSRVSPKAGPTLDRFALWPADGLTPDTIIGAQRQAVTSGIPLDWIEIIDQVYSRDGHYSSVTSQRVADVIKGSWRLTRAANDDAASASRNFVEECYRSCARWRDGLGWLLYSNLYGYNAVEIEWEERKVTFPGPRGEKIGPFVAAVPRRLFNVHPKHFRFDIETDDPLFWIGNTHQQLPIGKFVFLEGDGLHPIKVRHGHAWQCIWYSMFRSIGWSGWAVWVDRFALPVPVLKYDGDLAQYPEYAQAMVDIQNSLGTGKGVRYPRNAMELEFKDPPRGGSSNDPHSALSSACDVGQTIRVLGAEMTNSTGNTGSFAAKSQDMMVKFALEEFDAGRLWERIDEQLSAPLLRFNASAMAAALNSAGYNFTPEQLIARVPRGKQRVPRESEPEVEARIAAIYVNELGLPLSQEALFDRMDFARAVDDDDRVAGKAEAVAKGGALVPTAKASQEGGIVNPDSSDDGTTKTNPKAPQPVADNTAPRGQE